MLAMAANARRGARPEDADGVPAGDTRPLSARPAAEGMARVRGPLPAGGRRVLRLVLAMALGIGAAALLRWVHG
jgi:hypothetical protein